MTELNYNSNNEHPGSESDSKLAGLPLQPPGGEQKLPADLPRSFLISRKQPETASGMWEYLRFAYLGNPLPSLFKNRLFLYLSGFSDVDYSVTRHLGFLLTIEPDFTNDVSSQSLREMVELLDLPLPRKQDLDHFLAGFSSLQLPLTELPAAHSEMEKAVFACAGHILLESPDAPGCLDALKPVFDDTTFQHLLVFITFVRTAHYWTKVQKDLNPGDDMRQLMAIHDRLIAMSALEGDKFPETSRVLTEEFESLRAEKNSGNKLSRSSNKRRESEKNIFPYRRAELEKRVAELQYANREIRDSRHAALNVLEDAIESSEALRESEEKLSMSLRAARMGTYEWISQNHRLVLSKMSEEVFGLMPGKTFSSSEESFTVLHPDDLDRHKAIFENAGNLGEDFENEYRIIRPRDGRIAWIAERGKGWRDPETGVTYLRGVHWDVTERRQAEEALRESEARLQLSIRGANIFTWEVDLTTGIAKYSGNFNEVLGFEVAKIAKENFVHVHPDDKQFVAAAVRQALSGDTMLDIEHRIVNAKNDSLIWVREQGQLVRRSLTSSAFFMGITQNITTRKLAEDALRSSEARLQKAMEIATVGVLFFDDSGRFLEANKAFLKMIGYTRTQMDELNLTIADITPPEWMPRTAQALEELKTKGVATPYEKKLIRPDGSHWWGLFAGAKLRENESIKYVIDITTNKQAEQALQASEGRFRTLADAVPQVIWTNDGSGKANYFNQRWYEYSGLSYEASAGKGWEAIVHPEDAALSVKQWHRALEAGNIFDTEYRLRRKDGTYRWHIGRNVPLKDNSGKVLGWFGSATDIEDFKEAQEALRQSEARMRITMESATDYAIINMNTDGIIESWSSGAEIIFGYTEPEVRGKPGDIIFTDDDRSAGIPLEEMRAAKKEGRAIDERWHVRRDGSKFFMSGVMAPIYDGVLTGYVKVARDMTSQKAEEELLRLSEERYRIALTSAEMGAWDWNVVTNKVVWNEQHFLMLGLLPEESEKDTSFFISFVHPEDAHIVTGELERAVNETGIYKAEFRVITRDGKTRWMNGYGRAVSREGHRATRIVGVIYDITGRKLLEQQKDEFIGIASHELKTPVTSIKGYAQVLQEIFTEANDRGNAELMEKLDAQVDRLTDLIRSLLDTTKISEGQLILHKEPLNLNDLIEEQVRELQYISKKHTLVFNKGEIQNILGDKERIAQVITNLVTNAIKYSPSGGEVLIESGTAEGNVKVSVLDKGMGIPEDQLGRVFDRFFRVVNPAIQSFPGMGLGLYISAGIIHRHGGTISVASKAGEGSEFTFILPVYR